MKEKSPWRVVVGRRPQEGSEWLAVMVLGLDALEFLERSRDVAAEVVLPTPTGARPPQARK